MTETEGNDEGQRSRREELESRCTRRRIMELRYDPVRGDFDAEHLKEVNRRIFEDLPKHGFDDVTPGEYRPPVEGNDDWIKTRTLESVGIRATVAYSSMDEDAQARLDKALEAADPEQLGQLKTAEAAETLAELYTELDYIHPFPDGNSRTLREFTKELAEEAGFDLDWKPISQSQSGRDVLYIARDLSVNERAMSELKDDRAKLMDKVRSDLQAKLDAGESKDFLEQAPKGRKAGDRSRHYDTPDQDDDLGR